jgi:putative ABC transport system permease protein
MLFNYFKIAFRYLVKNKSFSIINIAGLVLGSACFLLIILYVHDELSFDMFHKDAPQIYRVLQHEKKEDGSIRNVGPIASRIGPEAVKQLPEALESTRLYAFGRMTMGNDPANRDYETMLTADENFLTFFDFPLVEGDRNTALKEANTVVISESTAKKYFGSEPALGKRLWSNLNRKGENIEFLVTAVMKDFPKNSHLHIDAIFSDKSWPSVFPWYTDYMNSDWSSNGFITYIKMKPGFDEGNKKAFENKVAELTKSNFPPDKEFRSTFSLQALKDIHLHSDNIQGLDMDKAGMKPFYLYMLGSVAVLILLIACLNYMNLSTAAAYKRTREIGTRKTFGAQKIQLVAQFTGEALILTLIALFISLAVLQMVLPFVNSFTEKELSISNLPVAWISSAIAIIILAGIASSIYPALIIARVLPAEAIKKDIKFSGRSLPVRKLLVIIQFSISIMMIVSTVIIYRQINYMRTKDLGFKLENLLVIDINGNSLRRNFESIKDEFSKIAEVQNISASTRVPGEWKSFPIASVKRTDDAQPEEFIWVGIDKDFLATYDIKLVEGRNFEVGRSDSTKVILTQLVVKQLGLTNPVGQMIDVPSARYGGEIETFKKPFQVEVIGVAEDFYFESFRQKMMPVIFGAANTVIQRIDYYTLRVNTSDWTSTLTKLKEVNNRLDTTNPMEYTFLDNRFEEFYRQDEKRGTIFLTFSFAIVFIACLGLFALVSFSIEMRLKEIGIRKVLGASVQNITGMISKEFLLLVIVGCLIAFPVSYLIMTSWLSEFAYHISPGPGTYLLSALLALLIASITISFLTIKAATSNPVDALKNE